MHLRKLGSCRGDGKIFIEYEIDVLNVDQLGIVSELNGVRLPVKAYPCASEEAKRRGRPHYVVAIPNMLGTQKLTFSTLDESGNPLGRQKVRCVNSEVAKWASRFNYRLNSSLTSAVRDCVRQASKQQAQIVFESACPVGDSGRVHGVIRIPEDSMSDLRMTCFGRDLTPIDAKIVWMGEQEVVPKNEKAPAINEVRFSIDLPDGNDTYYLFKVEDLANAERDNFAVLEPAWYKELCSEFYKTHCHAARDDGYSAWFEHHRIKASDLAQQAAVELSHPTSFSIVVLLDGLLTGSFDEMIESVLRQSYREWELILVGVGSLGVGQHDTIERIARSDQRIQLIELNGEEGKGGGLRAGIKQARGDYVAFLDQDDVLEPDTLFEFARAIEANPEIGLLYCDEDRILLDGSHDNPFFKPDFSIDLLRNGNYIGCFLCVKRQILKEIEVPGEDAGRAVTYDLALKATEKTNNVHHVAKMLHHHRESQDASTKPDAQLQSMRDAEMQALIRHLERAGLNGHVLASSTHPLAYNVAYEVEGEPLVSIIIPNKDETEILATCLKSILEKSTYSNYEIIIIENNSEEQATFDFYDELQTQDARIHVEIWDGPFNFSALVNLGARASQGDYLLLLNNDTEVITPDWIQLMLGFNQRSDVGVVGVKLWYPDDTIQHAGVVLAEGSATHLSVGYPKGEAGYFDLSDRTQNLSAVTAACMMTRRDVYEEVGGFDEEFSVSFNDVDYCLKVREAGYLVVYLPLVELYHYESLSRGNDLVSQETQARYVREVHRLKSKWDAYYVDGDPYYNRNLSYESGQYLLSENQGEGLGD